MSKAYLIIKYKYLHMMGKFEFFIMILIAPVLVLLGIGFSELVLMIFPLSIILS
jgi:hypothetical protein